MTAYLKVDVIGEAIDLGVDDSGRAQYSFNVQALKRPSASFEQELIKILVDAGVGIDNQSIFGSSRSLIPDTGTVITIRASGGSPPIGTHNDGKGAYRQPSAIITIKAPNTELGQAKTLEAQNAFLNCRNRDVA